MSDGAVLTAWAFLFGLIFLLIGWGAWRTYTPSGAALFALRFVAIGFGVVFAVRSTVPSSAPRLQAVGIITKIDDEKQGKSHTYTVHFRTTGSRELTLIAAATPLFFAEGRDTVQITYLDEKSAGHPSRAIAFRVVDGPRAGDGDAVSADWLGPWIGVPICCLLALISILAAERHKRSQSPPV